MLHNATQHLMGMSQSCFSWYINWQSNAGCIFTLGDKTFRWYHTDGQNIHASLMPHKRDDRASDEHIDIYRESGRERERASDDKLWQLQARPWRLISACWHHAHHSWTLITKPYNVKKHQRFSPSAQTSHKQPAVSGTMGWVAHTDWLVSERTLTCTKQITSTSSRSSSGHTWSDQYIYMYICSVILCICNFF